MFMHLLHAADMVQMKMRDVDAAQCQPQLLDTRDKPVRLHAHIKNNGIAAG